MTCHSVILPDCKSLLPYSHPYSQAGRQPQVTSDRGRRVEQVSGRSRRWPTGVLIFARQGLGIRVPWAPPALPSVDLGPSTVIRSRRPLLAENPVNGQRNLTSLRR